MEQTVFGSSVDSADITMMKPLRISFKKTSEFSPGGYDTAAINLIFRRTLDRAYDFSQQSNALDFERIFFIVVSCFNDSFTEEVDSSAIHEMLLEALAGIEKISILEDYDELTRDGGSDQLNCVRELKDSFSALLNTFHNEKRFYEPQLASRYLDSFFELSKAMVFSSDSYNLASASFRRSTFLKALLSFAAKKVPCKAVDPNDSKTQADFFCYEYSFFDPFAYDTISRALVCATRLIMDELSSSGEHSAELFELRKEMFICSIESGFQRTITLDNQTYRIELNRHTSKLIAYPIDMLSSTSDTKPIRLFEKTAAYIRRNLVNVDKIFKIHVTVIGHTELSNGCIERSIADYVNEVLAWYSSLKEEDFDREKPQLELTVRNILNFSGKPDILAEGIISLPLKRESVIHDYKGNNAQCIFEYADYESTFAYTLKSLKSCIDDSEILFLLDCPWLSTENYAIGKEGPLETYCNELQQQERDYPRADSGFERDSSYFYRASPMAELSNQFNRIMSSTSSSAGAVVRAMRDDMIRKIQDYMNSLRNRAGELRAKELYLFSSENEGVNYSYFDSYPLTRLEQYDGKRFTIIQFYNKKMPMLKRRENGKVHFEIDLWSVLKYLCIPYAYQYAVKQFFVEYGISICDADSNYCLEMPIQYLELQQNIIVVFDVSADLRIIHISLGFTDLFDNLIREAYIRQKNRHYKENSKQKFEITDDFALIESKVEELKELIGERVLSLITPLYRDAVFARNSKYGDDAIKLGFKMTLYSAAQDVNAMLFCHLYREACNKGNFSRFTVIVDSPRRYAKRTPRDFKGTSFFADKKLYSSLFTTFEQDSRLYLGMIKMLEEAKNIYDSECESTTEISEWKIARILFENIKTSCEQAGLENSRLYSNVLRALFNLS